MKAKKLSSWIGGGLAAILVGAMGSGVWSGILSPALSWLVDKCILIRSQYSESFSDDIYAEAARGFCESDRVYYFAGLFSMFVVIFCYVCFGKGRAAISIRKWVPRPMWVAASCGVLRSPEERPYTE